MDLAIDRIGEADFSLLDVALKLDEADANADVTIPSLHAAIARLAGNRALELVALVLIRLTRFHQFRNLSAGGESEIRHSVTKVHKGIARAVKDGDRDLARRRLRKHLAALARYLDEDPTRVSD